MFSKKLLVTFFVISVLIAVVNCTQTEEKVYGEGICQYPENCTQPQVPPPSTDQPYDVPPPPKPKTHPPKPSIPEQPVPTGYSPITPPPPPAASAYPDICPPPPSPPAAEGQYSPDTTSIPPPNPYTYLNETTDSADAPPSALPMFSLTAVFYILFLFAYHA